MEAARLNLRLFIDGYEVPVVGARCQFVEGAPATAQVQLIATDEVWQIQPRSLVTLFYYHSGNEGRGDATSGEGAGSSSRWGEGTAKQSSSEDPREYKLLFLGTIIGIGFQKSQNRREAILHCADPSELWDVMFQHGTNSTRGGLAMLENAFLGVNMNTNTSNTATGSDLSSNLESWITSSEVDGEMNLMAGIQRTMREIFFAGSIFYARTFNRLRISDQIVGLREDKTSSNLMSLRYFQKFLRERVGQQQGLISVRKMLDLLLAPILSNYVTIPCPKFDPNGECLGMTMSEIGGTELNTVIPAREAFPTAGLNHIVVKPDSWFNPPPACNLIFPHMYESFDMSRQFTREPTRLLMRTEDFVQPRTYESQPASYTADGQLSPAVYRTSLPKKLNDRLYAPDFEFFSALLESHNTGQGGYLARLHNRELPHEYFIGPHTQFTYEGLMGKYASKNARRQYLSYFADYLFWKIKFAARAGSVRMAFTPNLIPGYSAIVFDRADKHFVGHIDSLIHSVTQAGGTTQVSLIAVRPHDEDIDFTEQGRTQEEVILGVAAGEDSDGTKDTFLDDRYNSDRIGDDVYTPLYGTGSVLDLYDMFFETGSSEGGADLSYIFGASEGRVKRCTRDATAVIFQAYKLMLGSDGNVGKWTQGLTHRPKANLVDIMGFSQDSTWTNFSSTAQSRMETGGGGSTFTTTGRPDVDGFMAGAIDKDHADANLLFTAKDNVTTYRMEPTTVERLRTDLDPYVNDADACLEGNYESVPGPPRRVATTVNQSEEADYGIGAEVHVRQIFVKAYVDSLLLKGLRG